MAYNTDENHPCDTCGITPKQADREGHGAHFTRGAGKRVTFETSFRLGQDGGVSCAKCHKERSLRELFDLTNRKDKARNNK